MDLRISERFALWSRCVEGQSSRQFLGGAPAEFPNRYREGSVSGLLPTGVRQELFVAGRQGEPWTGLFKQYVAAAEKSGDPVRIMTMEGAGHFDGINPQAPAWEAVMEKAPDLLIPR